YDDCALAFTQTLYEVLAMGRSIDEAVTAGRQAMRDTREDARDWGVPVLYLRVVPGHDGVIFPFVDHVEWDELLEHSSKQTSTYWRALQGTPARPTAYMPEVYVERQDVAVELDTFLARQEPAVVLLGESGVGKTNVLCRWVQRLQEARHAVFFYDCGGSIEADIERLVARDLMVAPEDLPAKLAAAGEAAGMEGKQCVIIFDGINKFSGSGQGPADLLKSIDALAGRLPPNVRILISCSTHIWSGIQRGGRLTLLSHIYYYPANEGGTPGAPVTLDQFTEAELKAAYDLYQEAFLLHTPFDKLPAGLRSQLRKPLWLSLLAQTYKGREDPITYEAEALRVCRDYFKRYADKDTPERRFVMLFVAEMVEQQKTALTTASLQANQQLAEFMQVQDDGRSTYLKLLDCWFLVEIPGANEIEGDLVSFSCNQIAGYAIALQVGQAGVTVELITQLVSESRRFSFAWSAARALLMLTKPPEIISALAASTDPELRELVVESLVQLYDEEPAVALQMIEQLLDLDSEQVQRTALKAALRIGPGAVDIFLSAGTRGSVSLRRAAKDTLYLAWQSNQVLIYDVLDRLVASIGIGNMVGELFRGRSSKPQVVRDPLLKFIIELSVTCYINRCDEQSITEKTDALYYELLKNKLHMNILKTPVIGGALTRLAEAFTTAFSRPIVEAMLLSDLMPVERFFKLPPAERQVLKRLAQLLEPNTDLGGAKADLVAALSSDILLFNIVAAHLLPIHAMRDFKATEPVLRDLYDSLEPGGKLWFLLSFCVLLPNTPAEWVGFLEEFTSRLIGEHREVFYGERRGPVEQLHLMLLPLGLAYGKRNQDGPMPLLSQMLREVVSGGDSGELTFYLSALGTVGFYYPRAVLRILREEITDFSNSGILAALERPLAVMRTVHFDDVDAFLAEKQAGEDYRHRISTLADVNLVQQYIWWLGLYNNVVHEVVFYPRMRRQLSMGMLDILSSARDMYEVISKFTSITIDMLCEADFHLIEWTRDTP
ncbi:MAG TPA: NACHT domain-containing protein, partial [Chloroflexia bacterium]